MDSKVRPCSGAGTWFPANPSVLEKQVLNYINSAPDVQIPGRVIAVVSPHAGYMYCGDVMGAVYKSLKEKQYKRVIFLAFSHSYPVKGLSTPMVDAYETPLGTMPVDKEMRDALLKHDLVTSVARAHAHEHSDENQMPFVQVALQPGWKMISIYAGDLSRDEFNTAAEILKPFIDSGTLIVVSSDFTHYGHQYGYVPFTTNVKENMKKLDGGAIDKLLKRDFDGFQSYLRETGATICGRNPLSLLIKILPPDAQGKLIKYMTSGDVSGDYDMAVGYAGIAFFAASPETKSTQHDDSAETTTMTDGILHEPKHKVIEPEGDKLTDDERKTLLNLSRDALLGFLKNGDFKADKQKYAITPRLKEHNGVFVTLTKQGQLRGCIGYVEGIKPLWEAVIDNTQNAAFEDPRFPSVKLKEFDDISIEISVMTPLHLVKSVDEIVIGKHGLVIEKGWHRGLLLPQVPVEWKWDRDEFLVHICAKAGLPATAWKDPSTKLYVFSAQVFSEEEFPKPAKQ